MANDPVIKLPGSYEHQEFLKIKASRNLDEGIDFYTNPLLRGCYPTRKLVEHLYLEKNLTLAEMLLIFNITEGKFLNLLKLLGISKPKKLVNESKRAGSKKIDYIKRDSKTKATNLLKYGVENVSQAEEIKQKKEQKAFEKYGVKFTLLNEEIKNRIKQTNLLKYGVSNPGGQKFVLEKAKATSLKKYGASHYSKTNEYKDRVKQTNLERYGVDYAARSHLKNINEFNRRGLEKFINSEGYFDVSESMEYFNCTRTCILSNKARFGITAPNKKVNHKEQDKLFNLINCEYKLQDERSMLGGPEIDIYLPSIKLAIEYNGLMFHSEGAFIHPKFENKSFDYHLNKTLECESKGIQLFHIFEGEDLDLWLSMIHNKLNINKKIYARDCIIKEIKSLEIVNFLNENHIQGYANAKICLGLYYNKSNKYISEAENCVKCVRQGDLLAVMTFSKPRFNKGYEYELIRFCSLKHHNILGAASKLFKYFIKKYNPKSIISYANRRFSNGDIYKTLGFTLKSVSQPNYFYFKDSEILESRNKYQKHKLEKYHLSGYLNYFNKNESEAINMFKNGYRRIFDCGNLVFEYISI